MFMQLASVVVWCLTVTGYGVSLSEATGKRATPLNNSSQAVIFGDQCVTRDEVQAIVRSEIQALSNHLESVFRNGSFNNPALSCKHIPQGSSSGKYWIVNPETGSASYEYCDMTRRCCSTTGGWMRVADLDMTAPNQQCPSGFRLVTSPVRACGKPSGGCVSTTFQTHGIQYSKVCGKIIGYQQGTPDAFHLPRSVSIDSNYVDGVSLTHGQSPRKHIWTFAAAAGERLHIPSSNSHYGCPCTRTDIQFEYNTPPFIGQDYFCETGSRGHPALNTYYVEDPLWNGQGCRASYRTTCCSFNNPPWFCKILPQPTSDDIELRLCGNEHISNEDTPIESVELYIQ